MHREHRHVFQSPLLVARLEIIAMQLEGHVGLRNERTRARIIRGGVRTLEQVFDFGRNIIVQ